MSAYSSFFLFLTNLLLTPLIFLYKLKKYKTGVFLNPFFLFVFFGFFYFVLSSKFVRPDVGIMFQFDDDFRNYTDFWMSYFYFTILIFYCFTSESSLTRLDFELKYLTILLAKVFYIFGAFIWVYILIKYSPILLSQSGQRVEQNIIQGEIASNFFFWSPILLFKISGVVVIWGTKRLSWALLYILPVIYGLVGNSRAEILSVFIFLYPSVALLKGRFNWRLIASCFLISTVIVYMRNPLSSLADLENYNFFALFGEVYGPRKAVDLVLSGYIGNSDLITLIGDCFSRLVPSSLLATFFEKPQYYVTTLMENASVDFGLKSHLMGSPVAEAYFYGGKWFLIVFPSIVGIFLVLLNKLRLYRSFPGLIFLLAFSSRITFIMREGFFHHALAAFYVMFSWYLWITLLEFNSKMKLEEKYIRPRGLFRTFICRVGRAATI